jgi:Protein of unknown function (DUF3102)
MADIAIIPPSHQSSLDDLAAKVRTARGLAFKAASNVLEHSIECGRALTLAEETVKHGGWFSFLEKCDIGPRQAERYMQLTKLARSNPSSGTDLVGLPIQAAIRLLSPPKKSSARSSASNSPGQSKLKPPSQDAGGKLNSLAWSSASLAERRHFLDAIGGQELFEALPGHLREFLREVLAEPKRLVNGHASDLRDLPVDLSIPISLMRKPEPVQ